MPLKQSSKHMSLLVVSAILLFIILVAYFKRTIVAGGVYGASDFFKFYESALFYFSGQNIYSNDTATFLKGKIEFHKSQMKFHRQQMELAKANLDVINSGSHDEDEAKQVVHPESDFKLGVWKPKVREALSNATTALTSDEILRAIDARFKDDHSLRKKAIGAISNSLQTLIREGEVERFDNEGRGNKYVLKSKAPAMTGAQ